MLDEWSTGTRRTTKLETKQYGKIYNAILNGLDTVDKHDYYGPLLRQRLAAWAGFDEFVFPLLHHTTLTPFQVS